MASRFHRPRFWLARVTTRPSASADRSASCTFRPRGVFGLPDGLRYQFGQRTVQPDVVAIDVEGKYAGGIEVKIRSNFNVNVGGSQFDTYAAGVPADCRLTALVAHSASASKFRAKLAADNATSADRWNTVTLTTLHGAVIKAAADAAAHAPDRRHCAFSGDRRSQGVTR